MKHFFKVVFALHASLVLQQHWFDGYSESESSSVGD